MQKNPQYTSGHLEVETRWELTELEFIGIKHLIERQNYKKSVPFRLYLTDRYYVDKRYLQGEDIDRRIFDELERIRCKTIREERGKPIFLGWDYLVKGKVQDPNTATRLENKILDTKTWEGLSEVDQGLKYRFIKDGKRKDQEARGYVAIIISKRRYCYEKNQSGWNISIELEEWPRFNEVGCYVSIEVDRKGGIINHEQKRIANIILHHSANQLKLKKNQIHKKTFLEEWFQDHSALWTKAPRIHKETKKP